MSNHEITDGISIIIKYKWKIALTLLILSIAIAFISIIFPLMDGIVLGIVLAYVARPMKHYLDKYIPALSPYIATMLIVLPIFLIIGLGVIEIFNQIIWIAKNHRYVVNLLLSFVENLNLPDFVKNKITDVIVNFSSYLLPVIKQLPVGTIVKSVTLFVINILISIILCFFLLLDGAKLVDRMMLIIPDEVKEFSERFLKHLDAILSSIFIGNAYSSIAVGILSLIVFSAFGLSNVLALSALMLIAALVPMFAGSMVIIPLTIYRYYQSGAESAVVFFVVCLFAIMIPPEVLIRPYIIHTQSRIHPMLIIMAFIGGGLVGGIAGFFSAPIFLGGIIAAYRANVEMQSS